MELKWWTTGMLDSPIMERERDIMKKKIVPPQTTNFHQGVIMGNGRICHVERTSSLPAKFPTIPRRPKETGTTMMITMEGMGLGMEAMGMEAMGMEAMGTE